MSRNNTRGTILEIGVTLICGRGYNGFSYQHIADQLNVKKAAIHYHFPSKEDLALAVLEQQREILYVALRFVDDDTAVDVFERALSHYQDYAIADGYCTPEAAISAEAQAIPDGVKELVKSLSNETVGWMENCLEKGRTAGLLTFEGSAKEQAIYVIALLTGAQNLSFSTSPAVMKVATDKLRQELLVA